MLGVKGDFNLEKNQPSKLFNRFRTVTFPTCLLAQHMNGIDMKPFVIHCESSMLSYANQDFFF